MWKKIIPFFALALACHGAEYRDGVLMPDSTTVGLTNTIGSLSNTLVSATNSIDGLTNDVQQLEGQTNDYAKLNVANMFTGGNTFSNADVTVIKGSSPQVIIKDGDGAGSNTDAYMLFQDGTGDTVGSVQYFGGEVQIINQYLTNGSIGFYTSNAIAGFTIAHEGQATANVSLTTPTLVAGNTNIGTAIGTLNTSTAALQTQISSIPPADVTSTGDNVFVGANVISNASLVYSGGTFTVVGDISMGGDIVGGANLLTNFGSLNYTFRYTSESGSNLIVEASALPNGNEFNSVYSTNDLVLTNAPNITAGVAGQVATYHNIGDYDITIQDEDNLTGSGFHNEGIDVILTSHSTIQFYWNDHHNGWVLIAAPTTPLVSGDADVITVRNTSGSTISAGRPVYVTGWNTGLGVPTIGPANNSVVAQMPAIGLTIAAAANNANVDIITFGTLANVVDTSGFSVNDALYVDASDGGILTNSRPTTATNAIQSVARVLRSHASTGVVIVQGAGRSNDESNMEPGNVWVGNTGTANVETNLSDYIFAHAQVVSNKTDITQLNTQSNDFAALAANNNFIGANVFSNSSLTYSGGTFAVYGDINATGSVNVQSTNVLAQITTLLGQTNDYANIGGDTFTGEVEATYFRSTPYSNVFAATTTLDSSNGDSQFLNATADVTLVVTPKAVTVTDGFTLDIKATNTVTVTGLDALIYTNQVLSFNTTNWSTLVFYSPFGSSNYWLRQFQPTLPAGF